MNLRLLPEAVAEANAAALWYDKQRLGLGEEFMGELQSALATIRESSHGMAVLECDSGSQEIRRHLLKRFPYMVVFAHHEEECLIVAVAHTRRRPLYWSNRLV